MDRERALVDDQVTVTITLAAGTRVERLEVLLVVPPGMEGPAGGSIHSPRTTGTRRTWAGAVDLAAGEERDLAVRLSCRRWGAYWLGDVHLRAHDRFRLFTWERHLDRHAPLKVFPVPDALRALVSPAETQVSTGSHVAPQRGDGIEFADLRPFVAGDRVRRINWRATSRRRVPYVNVQHPEHSADVVLFLDTFAEAEHADEGTLDAAVQAAAALASAYLGRRDRVALVSFGGVLHWLTPAAGTHQLYRIADALVASDVRLSYAWKDVTHLPRRLLPARALVLALSPLLDARGISALLDLRARGYDLAVLEISPMAHTPADAAGSDRLPLRLWRLQRDALRARFETLGVPVAHWEYPRTRLELAIEEVTTFRRHARRAPRA